MNTRHIVIALLMGVGVGMIIMRASIPLSNSNCSQSNHGRVYEYTKLATS